MISKSTMAMNQSLQGLYSCDYGSFNNTEMAAQLAIPPCLIKDENGYTMLNVLIYLIPDQCNQQSEGAA